MTSDLLLRDTLPPDLGPRDVEPNAPFHLAHPFETLDGPEGYRSQALAPLARAFPDLERRETIRVGGVASSGARWVGACGYWTGTFAAPFLDIPPTRRMAAMRFHEFFRVEERGGRRRVVEFQGLWDIPELMMQAGCWPMGPSLGREWHVPGPATQDGLVPTGDGQAARTIVHDMLVGLGRHAEGGPEAMELERYWHPALSWYGPSGIGTARGIDGFRRHHQIPFLAAMPDRVGDPAAGHLFAQGHYVAFTGWPGMHMTLEHDGWLGIAPAGRRITMRSLDFWRVNPQTRLIEENWVLIDLLHVWHQLGVDVLRRMREMTT